LNLWLHPLDERNINKEAGPNKRMNRTNPFIRPAEAFLLLIV
jgi:hypothetical protein